jgi:hypothetical protein
MTKELKQKFFCEYNFMIKLLSYYSKIDLKDTPLEDTSMVYDYDKYWPFVGQNILDITRKT